MKILLIISLLLVPSIAHAQDKPALIAFGVAASADWATTYQFSSKRVLTESNPTINWLYDTPKAMVLTGAAIDVVGTVGWFKLTKRHTRIRAIGLYSAAAFRVFLAVRNEQRYRAALRLGVR